MDGQKETKAYLSIYATRTYVRLYVRVHVYVYGIVVQHTASWLLDKVSTCVHVFNPSPSSKGEAISKILKYSPHMINTYTAPQGAQGVHCTGTAQAQVHREI